MALVEHWQPCVEDSSPSWQPGYYRLKLEGWLDSEQISTRRNSLTDSCPDLCIFTTASIDILANNDNNGYKFLE